MEKIDLTFGIPMYNCEKYITELLACFKEQNNLKYEIIIVNDGSTDGSLEICKKQNNKHIRIISQENKGASVARNTIIDNSKRRMDYIC